MRSVFSVEKREKTEAKEETSGIPSFRKGLGRTSEGKRLKDEDELVGPQRSWAVGFQEACARKREEHGTGSLKSQVRFLVTPFR